MKYGDRLMGNERSNRLKAVVKQFENIKALVVGDIMLDEYIWGKVKRISPEAPVPVVEVISKTYTLGGAGNVAANIASLNAEVYLSGIIGEDSQGLILKQELEKRRIAQDGLMIESEYPTITKSRVIAHDQQIARLDIERRGSLSDLLESKIIDWVNKIIGQADVCVVSDYGKSVISDKISKYIIELANKYKKPVVVDPKGVDYYKYARATVITPNMQEVEKVMNCELENEEDLNRAALNISQALDGSAILVTRGSEGMSLFINGANRIDIPAEAKSLYDVTGAGDTFVGTLALALGANVDLEHASIIANAAAGIAVEKLGVATISQEELILRL